MPRFQGRLFIFYQAPHSQALAPASGALVSCLQYKSFENTLGKGEIAHNEQFLLFPQCFLQVFEIFLLFSQNLKFSSANFFIEGESKICHLGKDKCNTTNNAL